MKSINKFLGVLAFMVFAIPSFAQINWSNQSPAGITADIWSVAYANNTFAATTTQGQVLTSTDGLNWSSQTVAQGTWLVDITYGNGKWVAVGAGGTILVSSDLKTWVSAMSGTTNKLNGVLYNGTVFLAVGDSATIISSPDSINWTLQPALPVGITGFLHGITLIPDFGAAVPGTPAPVTAFLVSGAEAGNGTGSVDTGILLAGSSNGKNFGQVQFIGATPGGTVGPTTQGNLEAVLCGPEATAGNAQVVSAGWGGSIIHDSAYPLYGGVVNPTESTWSISPTVLSDITFRGLTYGNGYWVVAGEQGTILTSMDGSNWTQRSSSINSSTVGTTTLLGATYSSTLQCFVVVGTGGTILVSDVPRILPMLTTGPVSETVNLGGSVTFSATATGDPSPTYQWQLNGVPISGATSSSLTINNAQLANEGTYTVVATNGAGGMISGPATLIVNQLPTYTYSTSTFAAVTGAGPNGVVVDSPGNVYVTVGNAVERVTSSGGVILVAGSLTISGWDHGVGSAAEFNGPAGIATDSAGNIYVADTGNNSIRKVTPLGQVTTLAGLVQGNVNGVGVAAEFNGPTAVAVDSAGNIYVVDTGNNELREVTPNGATTTLISGSSIIFSDIPIISVPNIYTITAVAVDSHGTPYVAVTIGIPFGAADFPSASVAIASLAGVESHSELFNRPVPIPLGYGGPSCAGLTVDGSGNIYAIVDGVFTIFRTGQIVGLASFGKVDFAFPQTFAVDSNGKFYVADPATKSVTVVTVIQLGVTPNVATQPVGATIAFGTSATLSVLASGTPTPTYQWQLNGVSITGATASSYLASTPGTYTVVLTNSAGSVTSTPALVTATTRLINISTRAQVGTGANVEIAGFVVSGPLGSTEQLLVRGVGPTLTQSGVSGVLAQPVLTLYDSSGNALATNTGWGTNSNAAQIASTATAVGAFSLPLDSADSALLVSLPPGTYTAEISGLNSTTGVALAEVYEVASGSPEIINVSTRAFVSSGASVEIAGIVVTGSQSAKVLVRAVGPTLRQFGVSGELEQPTLSVVDSSGNTVASNTGWGANSNAATIASETLAIGTFSLPSGSADCALLLTLAPGSYTAVVSGVGGTSGVCLVEAYQAP